jgi:putative flippase GtrA
MTKKNNLRKEVIGFSLVGSGSFLVDFTVFNLFVLSGLEAWVSNILAIVSAATVGFFGNSLYSFRHRFEQGSKSAIATRYIIFTLVSVFVSISLTTIVLVLLGDQSLLIVNLGRVSVILSVVVLRFLGLKFFVYRSNTGKDRPSA